MSENIFKFDENSVKEQFEKCETSQTQLSPFTKENLRKSVMTKRAARGESTLIEVGFNQPIEYELTEAEIEKRERRKEQNRRAARKCRLKKKQNKEKGLDEKTIRELESENEQLNNSIHSATKELAQLQQIVTQHELSGQCVRNGTSRCHTANQSPARDQQVPDHIWSAEMIQYQVPTPPMYSCFDNHASKGLATLIHNFGQVGLTCQSQDGADQSLAPQDGCFYDRRYTNFQYSPVSPSDQLADQPRDVEDQWSQLQGDETSTDIRSLLDNDQQLLDYTYNNFTENVPKPTCPITGSDTWLSQSSGEHMFTPEIYVDSRAPEPEGIPSNKIGIPSLDAIEISQLVSPRLISGFPFSFSKRH